jgi:hypothetical protein
MFESIKEIFKKKFAKSMSARVRWSNFQQKLSLFMPFTLSDVVLMIVMLDDAMRNVTQLKGNKLAAVLRHS